ncbi:MAG: SPOR domain-containing protein, partial [Candidatus Firestonebacteria bacterium]|nr:SPOR domain-containing protein [Candidatus Firestonebacteria bacterium]
IFYRVRVGKFHLLDKARDAREELEERGYEEAMVVAE